MRRTLVIRVPFGGLGDHLFRSHLPRIAKETGVYERVLVSNLSEYRDPEIRTLVWEQNPFIDGFTDEDAPVPVFPSVPKGMNLLDRMMLEYGMDDGTRFHEPEIYYRPGKAEAAAGKSVYDPNWVSNTGIISKRKLHKHFRRSGLPDFQMPPRAKTVLLDGIPFYPHPTSLFEYCNILASAERFTCLLSGGATLAAALGVPAVVLYGRRAPAAMFRHSRLHRYEYIGPSFPERLMRRLARGAKGDRS
ncbi:MAG: hypothetical protein QHI48_06380 [Bacteroidota bacterium]|nr:hypothetical protein [Bacteroidota bacterium]